MKNFLLLLILCGSLNTGHTQNLANTIWLGTNPPSPNLWFYYTTDTLYYSFTGGGYTPLSLYTASNGQFAVFDLPGLSTCSDTGIYNYSIVNPNLFFSSISDNCVSRKNTFLNYNWILLSTGITGANQTDQIIISQLQEILKIDLPDQMKSIRKISLFDMNGREVFNQCFNTNNIKIDIGFLSNGIYIGRIQTDSIYQSFKFVR